jgi:hypothetical protein
MAKLETVVCQKWEESERGWIVRPDGHSLHLNPEDLQMYVKEYWAAQPDEVPDEYSRPCGAPVTCIVDEKIYTEVKASKKGLRFFGGRVVDGIYRKD